MTTTTRIGFVRRAVSYTHLIKFNMVLERGKIDIDTSSHGMMEIADDRQAVVPDVLVSNFVFGKCRGFAYESIRSFIDQLYTCLLYTSVEIGNPDSPPEI